MWLPHAVCILTCPHKHSCTFNDYYIAFFRDLDFTHLLKPSCHIIVAAHLSPCACPEQALGILDVMFLASFLQEQEATLVDGM